MLTLISFILCLIGCLNWFCIGFFQYDFVAGIFGYQANIFSRIIYIIIGLAALWLTFAVIKYKGRLTVKQARKDEKREKHHENSNQRFNTAPQNTYGGYNEN